MSQAVSLFAPYLAIPIGLLLLEVLVKWAIRSLKKRKLAKLNMDQVDNLSGEDFELFLMGTLKEAGWRVQQTPRFNDGGADLVLIQGSERAVLQAKRYRGHVGVQAVQEVVASKPRYQAEKAIVATNSTFTAAAKKLAKENKVLLWDRYELIRLIESL